MADLVDYLWSAFLETAPDNAGMVPPPARNPERLPPPLPMANPERMAMALPTPNPVQRGAPPLPTMKPPPAFPMANPQRTAMPLPAPNPAQRGAPPLPVRNPQGTPPLPARKPSPEDLEPGFLDRLLSGGGGPDPVIAWIRENVPGVERARRFIHGEAAPAAPAAATPSTPTRRPTPPGLPGTIVDNNAPNIVTELQSRFGGVPIAQGMLPMEAAGGQPQGALPRSLDAVGGPAGGTPKPSVPLPTPRPYPPMAGGGSAGAGAAGGPGIGPWETSVSRTPQITGSDVARFFRTLAAGAAAADPTAPPLAAFAQGMHGAMSGRRREEKEDEAAAIAADEREFNRRMKTTEAKLAQAREARESRRAEILNARTVTEIMKDLPGSVPMDRRLQIEKQLTDYAKALNDGTMSREELKQALDEYRTELERRLGISGSQGQPTGGDGSAPDKAARPMSRADFDALPSGAYFINPADGRVLRKK